MDADIEESRPKRQKRESSYKAKAFEKFKQLKSGTRNKYEIEEIENVYDTIDEKEYTKKVLARQDEDWIVDDDGSGYVEDGRDIFDDDLDKESIAAASSSKVKGVKRKKKAVSENAGKGNLQLMLSNMPAKKKEEEKLDNDEALSELLKEIDTPSPATPSRLKQTPKRFSPLMAKKAERDYVKSFASSIRRTPVTNTKPLPSLAQTLQDEELVPHTFQPQSSAEDPQPIVPEPTSTEQEHQQMDVGVNCLNDDFDFSQIEEPAGEVPQVPKFLEEDLMKDWVTTSDSNEAEHTIDLKDSDLPLVDMGDKKVFRFFWWDAFEDRFKQPGVVFLFGKVFHSESNSYVSCCVAVHNIERRMYFLPRATEKGTENVVTAQAVYTEINDSVMKDRQIKHFKSRLISKKYAFDPQIPTESDYFEVRYSAKAPPISGNTEGRTFSHVFGASTSYMEIFLLDRQIKGPCWLDVTSPVPVTNPVSWCKLEVNCNKVSDISINTDNISRPPLVVAAINMRRTVNPKTGTNEIVMMSCVINTSYSVEKQMLKSTEPFQKHFCVFAAPQDVILPFNLHAAICNYKATTLQKVNGEKALLNYFINNLSKFDCDVIVGHDLQGYLINVLSERLAHHQVTNFSKLSRLKRTLLVRQKLEKELFTGRLVCDIKISSKELIKSRSYDLQDLCQTLLGLSEGERIELEPEDVLKMFETSADILRLASLTMTDTAHVIKILYTLNIMPLALQITNIAGNVMSKTLLGGRSERNEYLLLHAFTEKGYIVPDKVYKKKERTQGKNSNSARKKPTYSGGLVLEPKVGFYDKLILLMDFNSLYPSIIQEYNICFTTMAPTLSEDGMVLPDKSLPTGILPSEIRKLVESRREVKKLMNKPENSPDLKLHYHIRQMALKLTANSMYGCLGFSNSRFYAKNLAALITFKGREILTNTKDLVQRMCFEVIYGDTDSIMINTNIVNFDEVFKIGSKIKQEINKMYKKVELDIDGVFKYLLLLKKKKYAAVTINKDKNGRLKLEQEYKGLDIVRRDWSRLASETGKFILDQIFSEQSSDDRVANIFAYLRKIKEDLEQGGVPLSMLVITKQLTKNPDLYGDATPLPHVQVALRYNKQSGGHLRAGDTVPYLICEDGTEKSATQRAYHVEELKNQQQLKIDVKYYLAQQIHPVISRICEPIEEVDVYQLADCLGVDSANLKKPKSVNNAEVLIGENVTDPMIKFRNVEKFTFKCYYCKWENAVQGPLADNIGVLDRCQNAECQARPVTYVPYIQNQLIRAINSYVRKYYLHEMMCDDPTCTNETTKMTVKFSGRFPICNICKNAVLVRKYPETDLYHQISYFHYVFDINKIQKKYLLENGVEKGFNELKDTVEKILKRSEFAVVGLGKVFSHFHGKSTESAVAEEIIDRYIATDDLDYEDEE